MVGILNIKTGKLVNLNFRNDIAARNWIRNLVGKAGATLGIDDFKIVTVMG